MTAAPTSGGTPGARRPPPRGAPVALGDGERTAGPWFGLLALAVLATSAACHRPVPDDGAEPGTGAVAPRVEGCWELTPSGDEAGRERVRRWIEAGDLPGVIRLDTAAAEMGGEEPYHVAWSYVHARRQRRPLAAWRTVGDDSIRVETPGAFSGTVLRLAVRDELLEGTAAVFTDVVEPGEDRGIRKAPVEGRPGDCPDERR